MHPIHSSLPRDISAPWQTIRYMVYCCEYTRVWHCSRDVLDELALFRRHSAVPVARTKGNNGLAALGEVEIVGKNPILHWAPGQLGSHYVVKLQERISL
jgi:hypothetical protein